MRDKPRYMTIDQWREQYPKGHRPTRASVQAAMSEGRIASHVCPATGRMYIDLQPPEKKRRGIQLA